MKNIFIILFAVFAASSAYSQKKVVEDTIFVSGVCEMCKERIEKALDLKGIKLAEWDASTQKLFIAYRSDKISEEEIHKTIVAAGHDTDKMQAKDEVYATLPFCCLHRDVEPHSDSDKDHHKPHH